MHPLTDKPVAGIYIVSVMSISYRKKALSAGQDVSSQWAFLICDCFVGMWLGPTLKNSFLGIFMLSESPGPKLAWKEQMISGFAILLFAPDESLLLWDNLS